MTQQNEPGKHHGDPLEELIDRRRAEGEDGHVAGDAEPSYTDNPSFAAQEGRSTDVTDGELDYVEEPGVGGVSGDPGTSEERPDGG